MPRRTTWPTQPFPPTLTHPPNPHFYREAIFGCPLKAIKWVKRPKDLKTRPLSQGYPKKLEDNVFIAGIPSKALFGGMAYLIAGGGNSKNRCMLIDTPEPDESLVQYIKDRGGLDYILYTHKVSPHCFMDCLQ